MSNQIKTILAVMTAVLLGVLIILLLAVTKERIFPAVDLSKTRSISMSAEGKVSAKPDIALISFSVVTQGKEAANVQEENDKKMKTVIDYLKSQGINEEDIKTSNYNLYPQYDYNARDTSGIAVPPAIVGYTLNQSVSVKIKDLAKVSSLVGNLTVKGVNQIESVAYTIEDPDKLKSEARDLAVQSAKGKAQDLASRLGVKLGRVINFSEGSIYLPQPYYDKALPAIGFGGGASPVEPGSQDVTISVTLTFELK